MSQARRNFAESVEFLSNGRVPKEEVESDAIVLDSVQTEYSSESGLTPKMRVAFGHANKSAASENEQKEMSAIRSDVAQNVREMLNEDDARNLSFGAWAHPSPVVFSPST